MWIIVILLLLPALGRAVLVVDRRRQRALPIHRRQSWALSLRLLGGLSLVGGVSLLVVTTMITAGMYQSWPFYGMLSAALLYIGKQALTVRTPMPGPHEDLDDPDVLERYTLGSLLDDPVAGRMRSVAWFLVVYPLLFVAATISLFAVPLTLFLLLLLAGTLRSRRSLETQILWLLAICVRHQIPIADELKHFAATQPVALRRKLLHAATSLEGGEPLALVLERQRFVSASNACAIRVAGGHNQLDQTLLRLAEEATDRMRSTSLDRLSGGLLHVAALFMIGTTLLSSIMYFIVPKMKAIFEGFGMELPPITKHLIQLSDLTAKGQSWTIFWVGSASFLITGLSFLQLVGWGSLKFPLLMQWFPRRDGPEVLRTLAAIIRSQSALPDQLQLAAERPGRPDLGARYHRLSTAVREGGDLGAALCREQLVSSGQADALTAAERAGHLEFMLTSLAHSTQRSQQRGLALWAELIGPIVVLMAGIAVAYVVVALFMPLVRLIGELS